MTKDEMRKAIMAALAGECDERTVRDAANAAVGIIFKQRALRIAVQAVHDAVHNMELFPPRADDPGHSS